MICSLDVSVVVPLYNAGFQLIDFHVALSTFLSSTGLKTEIIYIDDCSTDGSIERLLIQINQNVNYKLVRLNKNVGQYTATCKGLQEAGGLWVITIDQDFNPHPNDLNNLLTYCISDYDLIYAELLYANRPALRRWGSLFFSSLMRRSLKNKKLTGVSGSSCRLIKRELLDRILCRLRFSILLDFVLINSSKMSPQFVFIKAQKLRLKTNWLRLCFYGISFVIAICAEKTFLRREGEREAK